MDFDENYLTAQERARVRRWRERTISRVSHPRYGTIIVPHGSNLSAIENAAELWNCNLREIIGTAKVEWVPENAGPVRRPPEFEEEIR